MLQPDSRVGVAVSGGADSVVLLHLLSRLAGRFQIQPVVLHMNHGLRGRESDIDAQFVGDLAASLGLEFMSADGPVAAGNIEAEARKLRRQFFAACRQTHGLHGVALGHNRSDQAETVFHRLLRGTGLTGQAAMRLVSANGLIRPLLTTSRDEIRTWAVAAGIAWREDASNHDLRFTRNRLRHKTIPQLTRDYNPNLEAILAGSALRAQAEEDYWNEAIDVVYARLKKRTHLGSIFQIEDLAALHLALRRRLIRRALSEIRLAGLQGLTFEHVESILALGHSTHGHDRVLVPGADALRSFDQLLLCPAGRLAENPRNYELAVPFGNSIQLPYEAGVICIDWVTQPLPLYDNFRTDRECQVEQVQLTGRGLAADQFVLRNWRPGDELHRPGHQSPEKVKSLFQEYRVPLWDRRHWPVLVCDQKIAWVRGFGAGLNFLAVPGEPGAIRLLFGAPAESDVKDGI